MRNHKWIVILMVVFVLTSCSRSKTPIEEPDNMVVSKVNEGDYELLAPYVTSPVRQLHGTYYREPDVIEVGSRLLEKSKAHFSVDTYKLSEGQLINESRYNELLTFKSEQNPNGLMVAYDGGLEIDGVRLERPIFISDLYEFNFHKTNDRSIIDGVSVAIVMKRMQVVNSTTGEMVALRDETLYKVGQTMGAQLSAYLRALENMADVPIYITLYVQESDVDKLPDNYLPGHFIGDAYSVDNTTSFKTNNEKWVLMSSDDSKTIMPEVYTNYANMKEKIRIFTGDESVSLVGKAFLVDNRIQNINITVSVGAKTFLELYGLAQYMGQEISVFDGLNIPVIVDMKIYQNTRIIVSKHPGAKVRLQEIR